MTDFILASTSPRRHKLLRELGRPFRIVPPHADESLPPGLSPAGAAETIAVRKARSVAHGLDKGCVLGADTLVAVNTGSPQTHEIIGKPRDRNHAIEILSKLTRQPHAVITGICIIDAASGKEWVDSEATTVTMRHMTPQEIEAYVDSGEATGKAGAYAIQETGDRFVQSVAGSRSNVVGLPMELLRRMLAKIEQTLKQPE